MDAAKKKLLLGRIKAALDDRRIDKVSDATGMSRITIAKARDGSDNLSTGSITVLCHYLNIHIPG